MPLCKCSLPNDMKGSVKHRECLLQQNHSGLHLIRIYSENYLLWRSLDECFCNKIPCECFITESITETEAKKLIQNN